MDLSICILTRNQGELLRQCVDSCLREIQRGIAAEIIVIDNASTDGSPRKVAELFPMVRVIRNEQNLGFSEANNKAIRANRGRNVLILNDDTVLQKDSLALMLQTIDSAPDIGAVGPRLLNPDGSTQLDFVNRRFPHLRGIVCQLLRLDRVLRKWPFSRDLLTLNRDPLRSGETEHLAGACLLLRRSALEAVGLFDEGFYFWYEDADLCRRLRGAGWKAYYVSESEVIHWGSASLKKLMQSDRAALAFNSLLYYFRKHSSRVKFTMICGTLVLVLLFRLPVAAMLALSSGRNRRREWSRTMAEYLRIVRSIIIGPHQRTALKAFGE